MATPPPGGIYVVMNSESIMIVETNPEMRNVLRHAFETRGYLTWTCPAVGLAECIFEAVQPSLVVLDVEMSPSIDRLIRQWHEQAPLSRIVVLEKSRSLAPLAKWLETNVRKAA